jgi:hypothetical protein
MDAVSLAESAGCVHAILIDVTNEIIRHTMGSVPPILLAWMQIRLGSGRCPFLQMFRLLDRSVKPVDDKGETSARHHAAIADPRSEVI